MLDGASGEAELPFNDEAGNGGAPVAAATLDVIKTLDENVNVVIIPDCVIVSSVQVVSNVMMGVSLSVQVVSGSWVVRGSSEQVSEENAVTEGPKAEDGVISGGIPCPPGAPGVAPVIDGLDENGIGPVGPPDVVKLDKGNGIGVILKVVVNELTEDC